jgi:orotate phosphoribosyltransferase
LNEQKKELIALLIECKALQFGDFTLKSGEKSPFFVDLGCVRTGRALTLLGRFLAGGLHERFPDATLLFGPAYKGIALATTTALGCWSLFEQDMPVCYNRKESKTHGEKGLFIGQAPAPQDRVVIIDDVLSSGGTKLEAARALQEAFGVQAEGVLVTLDRTRKGCEFDRASLPVHALVNIQDLSQYLLEKGDSRCELVRRFYEGER